MPTPRSVVRRSDLHNPFTYYPLDARTDCLRLLRIEDSPGFYDEVSCRLFHVPFSERPVYDALSYTWGTEDATHHIRIHGKVFPVRRNLLDALRFLRHFAPGRLFWIDAVCINQMDVLERNRQLHIMPHIYTRAANVVVWLGAKYAKYYPKDYARVTRRGRVSASNSGALRGLTMEERDTTMLDELCADEYWNRVWIIQEIGKAQRISVCFGACAYKWADFINLFKEPGDRREFRNLDFISRIQDLNKQLEDKYVGGHTLRNLIITHREAKCKDPRDKIYGFVGLANDAHGFPMDYSKSLFEVWKDTISFVYSRGLVGPSDVVNFSRVVFDILHGFETIGDMTTLAKGSIQPKPLNRISPIITAKLRIIGTIRYMGPTPDQIVSSLDEADEWKARIVTNYSQSSALAHSDKLVHRIIGLRGTEFLSRVQSTVRRQLVFAHNRKGPAGPSSMYHFFQAPPLPPERGGPRRRLPTTATTRLFQLQSPGPDADMTWLLGIAPGEAEAGDLICQIPGIGRNIVVRRGKILRIIGTALFAESLPSNGTRDPTTPEGSFVLSELLGSFSGFQVRRAGPPTQGLISLSMHVDDLDYLLGSLGILR